MAYDDRKAWVLLKEAMEVAEKCDPGDCDCEECPIGKPMELLAHDAGVKVVSNVCAMISCLKDVCFKPKEYQYKNN